MDDRKVKLSEFIFTELFLDDAVEAESRLCQTKHFINANLSKAMQLAESEEHHGLACDARFQPFDLGRFQNILATRHTYLECRQHVFNAPNTSQSYFLRCECDV